MGQIQNTSYKISLTHASNTPCSLTTPTDSNRISTEEPDAGIPHVRVCGDYVHETHLSMLLKSKS